ncbi:YkgJ family cysteine cluster protein [Candidatus Woesearchaeota archaeon]|nr:YkgJ family cysteine cluster protein [Candidatus Woesearchaeota archaeon]
MIPGNCNFCGLCCTLAVKVTESEVKTIESLGRNRSDFTEKDEAGSTLLKRENGWCHFFELKNSTGFCKIYNYRPKPCSGFPGKRLCNLSENIVFSDMSNKHPNVKLLWKKAPKTGKLPDKQPEFPI